MSHIFSSVNAKSAVNMSHYGIDTVVLTEHTNLERIGEEFTKKPDYVWCDGRGKKYLHKMLKKHLLKEDKYFNKYPDQIKQGSERWMNFCDDCLIFAVLNSHLFDEPIYLIHPQIYAKQVAESPYDATSGDLPTLIDGISILQ